MAKALHFLVHNSFLFTVAVMGSVHLVLLTVMLLAGVTPLVYFNIVSVIIYVFCIILSKLGHIAPAYVSLILEVTVYSIVSTYYIGWSCGQICFLFSIVPIIIYFGALLFKGKKRWAVAVLLIFNYALYVTLYLILADRKPEVMVDSHVKSFLMLFATFAMIFSMIFYYFMYIYSSESEMNNLEKKNEKLSVDAQVDILTSLLNRRGFLPIVGSLMNEDRTNHFCISFCDLDNFKRINDSHGHDGGDEVLRHVSTILKKEMQGCESCRWGGEEFVILMRDYDFTVAKQKMEYIRKTVESSPTVFYNKRIPITVTIGLEEYKDIYKHPEEIIKVADERMYYGKQHGKNILIYENMD